MPVVRAKLEHLVECRSLLRHGRRAYTDFGLEDLPERLAQGPAVVGLEQGRVWGVACGLVETRPPTLPRTAPTRAYLRCIALDHHRSAQVGATELIDGLIAECTHLHEPPGLLVSYGVFDWLVEGLKCSGFDLLDTVDFLQLDRLHARVSQRPPPPDFLRLVLAEPAQLPELAALDATAFPPLWHFGERDLVELLMRCRVQVAYLDESNLWEAEATGTEPIRAEATPTEASRSLPALGRPVGYAAVCYNSRDEAQLARLAVAPDQQGRGIGRALLWDAVGDAAATRRRTLVLNTQHDNHRSKRLYLGMGFRELGESLPVYGRRLLSEG